MGATDAGLVAVGDRGALSRALDGVARAQEEAAVSEQLLVMWTIYDHPTDWPEWYVARAFTITPEGSEPGDTVELHRDIEALRRAMQRRGLYCLPRNEGDEPQIVETWI